MTGCLGRQQRQRQERVPADDPLQIWTGNGQDNQRFTLYPSPGEPDEPDEPDELATATPQG